MKFQPGNKYGRGRPKKPEIEELRKAIAEVEKTKDKKLLIYFVEKAYQNDAVLIALCKKLLPDIKAVEGRLSLKSEGFRLVIERPDSVAKG